MRASSHVTCSQSYSISYIMYGIIKYVRVQASAAQAYTSIESDFDGINVYTYAIRSLIAWLVSTWINSTNSSFCVINEPF